MEDVSKYIKKPYTRVIFYEYDYTYTGIILEFPGCIATGNNVGEVHSNLDNAAESWVISALAQGQDIPEPYLDQSSSIDIKPLT